MAEIIAKLIGGVVLFKMGLKPIFIFSFVITFIGSGLLAVVTHGNDALISGLMVMVKFGICMGEIGIFMGTILLFKTTLVGAAMGYCNVISRLVVMLAPMVAEIDAPIPMMTIANLSFVGAVLTSFINVYKDPIV